MYRFSSVGHYLTRKGRVRPFALSLVVALVVLPVATALAFFAATGTGTAPGVQAGTAPQAVFATENASSYTYAGPSTTSLMPGGTVSFPVGVSCAPSPAACPVYVSTINLGGWTSNKTGCDSTSMPGSFTMPTITYNANVTAANSFANVGTAVITWVNLATDQGACAGAAFTFTITTP